MVIDYVAEWFQFANADLASAEYLQGMSPQPLEIICYLSEQSAEKFLKGYLIFKGVENIPKTHNLILLCEKCSDFDISFRDIEKACGVLTRYGVQPRYPHEMGLTEHDVQKALEYARQIRDSEPMIQVYHVINKNR
jgi:HEPN domain-containing protein